MTPPPTLSPANTRWPPNRPRSVDGGGIERQFIPFTRYIPVYHQRQPRAPSSSVHPQIPCSPCRLALALFERRRALDATAKRIRPLHLVNTDDPVLTGERLIDADQFGARRRDHFAA